MQDKPTLSVTQLTNAIKAQLEGTFPNLRVQGEVSNFKRQSSGHLYFSLKDQGAQISCVMFRNAAASLRTLPKEGDQVILQAAVNVYPPRGNYQLVVRQLELAGLGELLMRLEQLKREIHARGWFRQEHKRPLPAFPQRIGLVTSPTGAAIQDILNVLRRRLSNFRVLVNPVRVQGVEAPAEIAQAIREFNQHKLVDVLIVGRGGGSIEDLWAFNEEVVAKAVFESEIPIVCAVGHESDHTIAEHVADMRAPTPSAAAELVAKETTSHLDALQNLQRRLKQALGHRIAQGQQRLAGLLRHPLWHSPYDLLGERMQQLDELRDAVDLRTQQRLQHTRLRLQGMQRQLAGLNPLKQLQQRKEMLRQWQGQLDQRIKYRLQLRTQRFEALTQQLQAIDPKNLLRKGYSIVMSEQDSRVVTGAAQLKAGDQVRIVFADGSASSELKSVQHEAATSPS